MTLWISIYLPPAAPTPPGHLESIATTLLQYTPELTVFDSRSLLLDVGASLSLFKGPRNLYQRIQTSLILLKAHARIGMAPTALGAWLMAFQNQTPQRRMLRLATLTRHLDTLHVQHFPAARPYLDWLNVIGCTTLQHLNQLPRPGLRQRTSPQVITHLDAAYGKTPMRLDWYQPSDTFQASCSMDFHTTYTHALMTAAHGLIEQLCGWLQARHLTAASMQFSLHHEKGRHACPPTCITLGLSTPSRHASDFLPLLKERLQREQLQAPVIAIGLHHIDSQPDCEPSGDLFPHHARHQQHENQLIDLLRARLGQDTILQPNPVASHVPEHANQWHVVTPGIKNRNSTDHSTASTHQADRYPFWMLDQPAVLHTHNDRPLYMGQPLQLIQGPERIESEWWATGQHEQRDYFVAQDTRHCRYWIYRERGSDKPHWFLHGLFA